MQAAAALTMADMAATPVAELVLALGSNATAHTRRIGGRALSRAFLSLPSLLQFPNLKHR
jgi:hypothetical protein